MRKFGILLFFVLLSRLLFAQYSTIKDSRAGKTIEYLFTIGDTIRFFPINPDYSGVYDTDYPCFYDIECMESGIMYNEAKIFCPGICPEFKMSQIDIYR